MLQNFGGDYFIDPEVLSLKWLRELHLDFTRYFEEERFAVLNKDVFLIGYMCGDIVCILKVTGKIAVFPYDMSAKSIEDLEIIAESFTELMVLSKVL